MTRLSTALKGKKAVPRQKAARKAILEGLTSKAADLTKENPVSGKKAAKKKEEKARPIASTPNPAKGSSSQPYEYILWCPHVSGAHAGGAEQEGDR